jgi:hypothetical protein
MSMGAEEGKILEAISRVLGRLDGLERMIYDVSKRLEALASTIYSQCVVEYIGGRLMRQGLPARVDAVIEKDGVLYVVKFKIVATRVDAEEIAKLAPYVAGIIDAEVSEVVPVIVASKYEGGEPPANVKVILC